MSRKTKRAPVRAGDIAAAERMWKEIVAFYDNVEALDARDPKRIEIQGEMQALAGPPPDPLLLPLDVAFMVIGEKVDILAKRFLRAGPLAGRIPEMDILERGATLLTIMLNADVLAVSHLRANVEEERGTRIEIEAILFHYRMWVVEARSVAIERLRQRKATEGRWLMKLLRNEVAATDRATRIAQVSLQQAHVKFESPEDNLRALEAAFKMHDAYRPKGLKNGEELLGEKKVAGAAGLALTLEAAAGPKGLLWFKPGAEIGVGPTQAKDVLDVEFGRWPEGDAEPPTLSMDAPPVGDESDQTLADHLGKAVASTATSSVETSSARAGAAGLGYGDLFREILDSIDAVAETNPEAALTMAAGVVQVIYLLRTEPKPNIRAGILYAWGRGDAYRGGLDPGDIGMAVGVSEKTVRRWEPEGLARLVAAGLRDPEEKPPS